MGPRLPDGGPTGFARRKAISFQRIVSWVLPRRGKAAWLKFCAFVIAGFAVLAAWIQGRDREGPLGLRDGAILPARMLPGVSTIVEACMAVAVFLVLAALGKYPAASAFHLVWAHGVSAVLTGAVVAALLEPGVRLHLALPLTGLALKLAMKGPPTARAGADLFRSTTKARGLPLCAGRSTRPVSAHRGWEVL